MLVGHRRNNPNLGAQLWSTDGENWPFVLNEARVGASPSSPAFQLLV